MTWTTAFANNQRTSYTPAGLPLGQLFVQWYVEFEPYITPDTQPITDGQLVYVATSRGLYAIDVSSGGLSWLFATALPCATPTLEAGVLYVPCMDRRLYALNVTNGSELWHFEAQGGFQATPLVVDTGTQTVVVAACRDGNIYGLDSNGGAIWSSGTGGPITQSPAAASDGSAIFAVSWDNFVYKINPNDGAQLAISGKLPGDLAIGFATVLAEDADLLFVTKALGNYRSGSFVPGAYNVRENYSQIHIENDILTDGQVENLPAAPGDWMYQSGSETGPWPAGATTYDLNQGATLTGYDGQPVTIPSAVQVFEDNPQMVSLHLLNPADLSFAEWDLDGDGQDEKPPFSWHGTHSGSSRYPPVVDGSGTVYLFLKTKGTRYIPRSYLCAWNIGTSHVWPIPEFFEASDEPAALSIAGTTIHSRLILDRRYVSADITNSTDTLEHHHAYDNENGFRLKAPGYDSSYGARDTRVVFGGEDGVYGQAGLMSPAVPINNGVFMLARNSLLFWSSADIGEAPRVAFFASQPAVYDPVELSAQALLDQEISTLVAGQHLRPGYLAQGLQQGEWDNSALIYPRLTEYYREPGPWLAALLRAFEYVSSPLQQDLENFIDTEWQNHSPSAWAQIAWNAGESRNWADIPDDAGMADVQGTGSLYQFIWRFNPVGVYATWKYAATLGRDAVSLLADIDGSGIVTDMENAANGDFDDRIVKEMWLLNGWIAGMWGYAELAALAGDPVKAATWRANRDRLLNLWRDNFTWQTAWPVAEQDNPEGDSRRSLNIMRSWLWMVPEQVTWVRENVALSDTIDRLISLAPHWFVSRFWTVISEGASQPLHDRSFFRGLALAALKPLPLLNGYLDVAAFPVGDGQHIENLVDYLESSQIDRAGDSTVTATILFQATFTEAGVALADSDLAGAEPVCSVRGFARDGGVSITPVQIAATSYDGVVKTWRYRLENADLGRYQYVALFHTSYANADQSDVWALGAVLDAPLSAVGVQSLSAEALAQFVTDDTGETVAIDGSVAQLAHATGFSTFDPSGDHVLADVRMINGALTDGSPDFADRPTLHLQQLKLECDIGGQGALDIKNASGFGQRNIGGNIGQLNTGEKGQYNYAIAGPGQYNRGRAQGQYNHAVAGYGQENSGTGAGQHNQGDSFGQTNVGSNAGQQNTAGGSGPGQENKSISGPGQYNIGTTQGQHNQATSGSGQQNEGTIKDVEGFDPDILTSGFWQRLTSTMTTVGSVGKQIVDRLDVAVSSRSSHSADDVIDGLPSATDIDTQLSGTHGAGSWQGNGSPPMGTSDGIVAGPVGAIWDDGSAADVSITTSNNAGALTIHQDVTFRVALSNLKIPSNWSMLTWTVDRASGENPVIQIQAIDGGDAQDGLKSISGNVPEAAGLTRSDGSLVVDAPAGQIGIKLTADATTLLNLLKGAQWTLTTMNTQGKDLPLAVGVCDILPSQNHRAV
ncbi:MAG: PQQ-binding-like beta-propeller repeat protein [Chloroflexota bacterium]|nr:PQQ-binding-like beta-propeller repeat protein [Chloroflexota bacterium]